MKPRRQRRGSYGTAQSSSSAEQDVPNQDALKSRMCRFLLSLIVAALAAASWKQYRWRTHKQVPPAMNYNVQDADTGVVGAPFGTDARVPYINPSPGTNPTADAIRKRRANGELLELDSVLLNSEPIAAAWNHLFGTLRNNNTIPADLRELLILRPAALNGATYEWTQHEPEGRAAGLTLEQLQEIRHTPAFLTPHTTLTPAQSAAMIFADWVTKEVHVPQSIYGGLKQFLTDRQMVDAVATVGGYNFLSRFVVALNVGGVMDVPVPIPQETQVEGVSIP